MKVGSKTSTRDTNTKSKDHRITIWRAPKVVAWDHKLQNCKEKKNKKQKYNNIDGGNGRDA